MCCCVFFHNFYSFKTNLIFFFYLFSISQLCFLFIIYLRFIITLAKGVFDLQIDEKKRKTQICLKWIKIVKKTTTHSQNILHVDALYNIKRKKYKTVCAELPFAKVTFDRMVMIFYRTCNVFFICYGVGLL